MEFLSNGAPVDPKRARINIVGGTFTDSASDDWTLLTLQVGDITAITAGNGLSGGGTSGAVSLAINTAVTMDLATAQAVAGAKTFNAGTLKANNAGNTFASTIASAATAARTATLPDASVTLASAGVATGTPSATAAVTPVNVTPTFTGTGCAAAGQVITTTDNQTMTLNQCAGMLFVSDGTPGNFAVILSNTAVTGAPAVLTVAGFAQTAAGAYRIFTGATLATAAHTHTQA